VNTCFLLLKKAKDLAGHAVRNMPLNEYSSSACTVNLSPCDINGQCSGCEGNGITENHFRVSARQINAECDHGCFDGHFWADNNPENMKARKYDLNNPPSKRSSKQPFQIEVH
jgi:hypothetical protein